MISAGDVCSPIAARPRTSRAIWSRASRNPFSTRCRASSNRFSSIETLSADGTCVSLLPKRRCDGDAAASGDRLAVLLGMSLLAHPSQLRNKLVEIGDGALRERGQSSVGLQLRREDARARDRRRARQAVPCPEQPHWPAAACRRMTGRTPSAHPPRGSDTRPARLVEAQGSPSRRSAPPAIGRPAGPMT